MVHLDLTDDDVILSQQIATVCANDICSSRWHPPAYVNRCSFPLCRHCDKSIIAMRTGHQHCKKRLCQYLSVASAALMSWVHKEYIAGLIAMQP